jgi:hypothetical protein
MVEDGHAHPTRECWVTRLEAARAVGVWCGMYRTPGATAFEMLHSVGEHTRLRTAGLEDLFDSFA